MRIEYVGVRKFEGQYWQGSEHYRVYRVHEQGQITREIGIPYHSSLKIGELLAGVAQ